MSAIQEGSTSRREITEHLRETLRLLKLTSDPTKVLALSRATRAYSRAFLERVNQEAEVDTEAEAEVRSVVMTAPTSTQEQSVVGPKAEPQNPREVAGSEASPSPGFDVALAYYQQALMVYRELRDHSGAATVLKELGDMMQFRDDQYAARAFYVEALTLYRELRDRSGEAGVLKALGNLTLRGAEGKAKSDIRSLGLQLDNETLARVTETTWETWDPGESSSVVDAPETLEESHIIAATSPGTPIEEESRKALGVLTKREREVAALVIRGMSNRQMAEELLTSERTVETHVARILSRLGLANRLQLVAMLEGEHGIDHMLRADATENERPATS